MALRQITFPLSIALGACSVLATVQLASAQYKNYSEYYNKNRSVVGQNIGTNAYLYDKYFYHSPGVSPYLNLGRLGSDSADAYHLYVRPEQQQREASRVSQARYVQQRKLSGNVGHTAYPGGGYMGAAPGSGYQKPVPSAAKSNPAYYNHWYGGWNKR